MFQNLTCKSVSFGVANEFYRAYEHLGNPGLGVYHWGTFDCDDLIAVVSFGTTGFSNTRGLVSRVADKADLKVFQLTRGGTIPSAPTGVPSWTVHRALRELRQLYGDCLIVAYSDTAFNEIGTIYQACNFHYLGLTNPKNQAQYVIKGRCQSAWVVRKKYGTRCMVKLRQIDPETVKLPLTPKHKYIYAAASPAKRRVIRKQLGHVIQPYPKRHQTGLAAMNVCALISRRAGLQK